MREAILEAIDDFKEICGFKIIDDSFSIEMSEGTDVSHIREEFCNYIIGLMKNKNMV